MIPHAAMGNAMMNLGCVIERSAFHKSGARCKTHGTIVTVLGCAWVADMIARTQAHLLAKRGELR